MHDWTLVSIQTEWKNANILITFRNESSEEVTLTAEKFTNLHIPKRDEWGESISVNEVSEVKQLPDGNHQITIEMQSGDVLSIEAAKIHLPI